MDSDGQDCPSSREEKSAKPTEKERCHVHHHPAKDIKLPLRFEVQYLTAWALLVCAYIVGPVFASIALWRLATSATTSSPTSSILAKSKSSFYWGLLGCLFLTVFPRTGRWPKFLKVMGEVFNPACRPVGEYHAFSVVQEGDPLVEGQRYMMAAFPHGIFPVAGGLHAWHLIREHGAKPVSAAASVLFRLPVLRQLADWAGLVPATNSSVREMCSRPWPSVSFILPGGIAEMFHVGRTSAQTRLSSTGDRRRQKEEAVVALHRKGFVKWALVSGAHLVPVYYLGQTDLYTRTSLSDPGSFLERLSRRWRISIVPFYGRWGLPLPHKKPLIALQGRPVQHPTGKPISQPSQAQIDLYHQRFLDALRDLYERNRSRLTDYKDRELVIV